MSAAAVPAYTHAHAHAHTNANANDAAPSRFSHPPGSGDQRVWEHIDDLKAKAAAGFNPHGTIDQLIRAADTSLKQAYALVDFRRPDLAFTEYLRASEIAVSVIPRNKEYTHFTVDQPERAKQFGVLQRKIGAGNELFAEIKEDIKANNAKHGTRPKVAADSGAADGHVRADSGPVPQDGGASAGQRTRPTPSPKPDRLHGHPVQHAHGGPAGGADLSERFARLRMEAPARPASRGSTASVQSSPPVAMPSAADYASRGPAFETLARANSMPGKPSGPRGMPHATGQLPPPMAIPNLPQAPPTAYSPARNMDTMGNIAPPRSTARSLASSSIRRSSYAPASAAAAAAPNGPSGSGDYFPTPVSDGRPSIAPPPRRTSVNAPTETEFDSQKFYDVIRRFNVLLIDFRSRHEFDEGHIHHRNIMCVDPLSVRQGMSAEELQDSLVLSPDNEWEMFAQRDQFDYVIYYDQSTPSLEQMRRAVGQRQLGMNYLRDALVDFNQEKPLRRPPILLKGGLDAWSDLAGPQSLVASETASQVKTGTPIRRSPLATSAADGNRELRVPKRRLREPVELDAEEEQYWRERARAESIVVTSPPEVPESDGQGDADGEYASAAIDEFNQRFPDAQNLDAHAFASQKPSRAPPEVPTKVPMYPPAPTPSQYPQAPTRPAPAAPRMSYQGVSDRAASAPQQRTGSSTLSPYIPPRLLATNIKLPKTGLHNFGNTCYMNSTLQALSATTPLSMFFMDDGYKAHLQPGNLVGSQTISLPDHFANLLRNLWKGDVDVVRPSTFRNVIRRLQSDFNNDQQQDAKEFLDIVLGYLHDDMNANHKRSILRELTPKEEAAREALPKFLVAKTEWSRYIHRDLSFLTNLLVGQSASRLVCLTCNFTSTTWEYFNSLSVEIPLDKRDWSNGRGPTIDDCIRSYCREETLTRDERWKCPHCNKERDAKKQLTITRAPQHLIIHLKRHANRGARSAKISLAVDFPLTDLDLGPYMLPPPSSADLAYMETHKKEILQERPEASMTPPYKYDCYAVVRHIGDTLHSGHYMTAARDQGRRCWRMFNDSRVGDFLPVGEGGERERLQDERAYILFYQRNLSALGQNGTGVQGRM